MRLPVQRLQEAGGKHSKHIKPNQLAAQSPHASISVEKVLTSLEELSNKFSIYTLPETIMEVEHRPLEDYFPLQVRPAQLP